MTTYNMYFGTLRVPGTKSGPGIQLGITLNMVPEWKRGGGSSVPVPVGSPLQGGTVGVVYSGDTISSIGGTPPYTYAVTSGSLPTGLSLNSSSGAISGTPSVAGTYSFTITATDTFGASGSAAFQIIIVTAASGAT